MRALAAPDLPELVAVALVLARDSHCASSARTRVAALPHAVALITSCLVAATPHALWSLPRACEKNLLTVLPRIAARLMPLPATSEADVDDANDAKVGRDAHLWAYQCGRGLVFAVRNDNLAMVEWLHDHCAQIVPYAAMVEAARDGNTRILEWLSTCHEQAVWIPQMMAAAASSGRTDMLQWLHDHPKSAGVSPDADAVSAAVRGGHLAAVKWLCEYIGDDAVVPLSTINSAVRKGHTATAKLLLERREWLDRHLCAQVLSASKTGNLELIEWICARSPGLDTSATAPRSVNSAARGGHLHVVLWFHEHQVDAFSAYTMDAAAESGNLELVRWLHTNRTEGCTAQAIDIAARRGHLEVVQWLHANRSEGCTTNAMDNAAWQGHLEVVKWLHASRTEGCTTRAMDNAAWHGHLEVIKWLHRNRNEGCTTSAMDSAARHGHLEIVKWLHEHRREGCTTSAMNGAAYRHLEIVKYLHEHRSEGCTTRAMDDAAEEGHLETLKWLHTNRSEGFSIRAMIAAARLGRLEAVKWLHTRRAEAHTANTRYWVSGLNRSEDRWVHGEHNGKCNCVAMALQGATENGNVEVVKWLCARRTERQLEHPVYFAAASRGHFEILLYLHSAYSGDFPSCLLGFVPSTEVCLANLEMVRWMHTKYPGMLDVSRLKQQSAIEHNMTAVLDHVLGLGSEDGT